MPLDTPVVIPQPPSHLGLLRLILDDLDGTGANMSAQGQVLVCSADGETVTRRTGSPMFMPLAWKQKMKTLMEELRIEVASRLTLQPTKE